MKETENASAKTKKQEIDGRIITKRTDLPFFLVPNKLGFNQNLWTDRSLNTNTKQFNLDFTKYLVLGKTEHNVSYSGSLSKSQKEMVNQSGDSAINVKWWALYPGRIVKQVILVYVVKAIFSLS